MNKQLKIESWTLYRFETTTIVIIFQIKIYFKTYDRLTSNDIKKGMLLLITLSSFDLKTNMN